MRRLLPLLLALALLLAACGGAAVPAETPAPAGPGAEPQPGIETALPVTKTGSMELRYATQFAVDCYSDGSALVTVGDADRFLVLPEGAEGPAGMEGVPVLQKPLGPVYLASSSAMDPILCLGALDRIRLTSTSRNHWALPAPAEAMDAGNLLYAGKYSAPDFELLLSEKCALAVENTMIYHSPAIREQIQSLGIPVLVERSSYENHPLGRVEWIKLYGLLLDREAEAETFFQAQLATLEELRTVEGEGRTVAFFHINSAGAAVVRKSGDYVTKMIELAGGRYVPEGLTGDENALSTMNMQMESFYAGARDADILIYNSTIDGELQTIAQLLEKSALLADFKAVRNGEVWCTEQSMFQQSSAAAGMIRDLNAIVTGAAAGETQLNFLHRLT